jgi:acetyltransferase-like isoleucine patch superfamily enzyme
MNMLISLEKISYFASLGIMLMRGTLYQLLRLQFRGLLLLGRGGKIYGLSRLKFSGIIKVGAYSQIDARFSKGIVLGDRFSLGDFSIVRASGSIHFESGGIHIGNHVSFGPYSNIGGGFGLEIGDDCVFGPYVSIHPEDHVFTDLSKPIRQQGISGEGITIGKDNWFGAKSTILDGAFIHSHCIFGAQSLAVKGIYLGSKIYVGSPVKPIRSRATI